MFTFGLPRHTWCLRGWEEFSSTSCQGYWLWRDHLSHPNGKNYRTILSIIKSFVCFSFIAPLGLSLMQNRSHWNGLDIPEIIHSIMKKDSNPLVQKEFPSFSLSQDDHKKSESKENSFVCSCTIFNGKLTTFGLLSSAMKWFL